MGERAGHFDQKLVDINCEQFLSETALILSSNEESFFVEMSLLLAIFNGILIVISITCNSLML